METRSIQTEAKSNTLIILLNLDKKRFGIKWEEKQWKGLSSFSGEYIWTDGTYIYYSRGDQQYYLNKTTSQWEVKTWEGLSSFYGNNVWTDGVNIYFSSNAEQYILNKDTSTWEVKTWNGLTNFYSTYIWTDLENIYYSSSSQQYILNKDTSTWEIKTWSGLSDFSGNNVFTDGNNIYCSYSPASIYQLDKNNSTWQKTEMNWGLYWNGSNAWTDGNNVYLSYSSIQKKLDKSTLTWSDMEWEGLPSTFRLSATSIWTDGTDIYYSQNNNQYILPSESPTIRTLTINGTVTTEWNGKPVKQITVDGVTYKMPETVEPALITFEISGIGYQAEEGMTWSEWVASSYNSGGYTESDGKIMRLRKFVYTPAGSVDSSDVIVPNESYTEETGGGTAS